MLPHFIDVIVAIPVGFAEFGGDAQHSIDGGDGRGIVKLHGTTTGGTGVVIRLVERRPHGIVTVGEGAILDFEFIRHDLQARMVGRVVVSNKEKGERRRNKAI